ICFKRSRIRATLKLATSYGKESKMNFKKAFTYIFEDPNWLEKLIVPLLVGLIPIVGQLALSGYVMRVIQNVAQRTQPELPSFDFGLDLGKGFRWFLVALVYSLPV